MTLTVLSRADDARRGASPVLGRGVRACLLLAGLAVASCGAEPSDSGAGEESRAAGSADWGPSVDVATIRTVGDPPPADRRIVIAVNADGALTADDAEVDLVGLRAVLREHSGEPAGTNPVDVDALLVLDRALPWQVAQALMQECASARMGRIFFAVRHVDGGPGAIATFLPVDAPVMHFEEIEERAKVVVRVRRGQAMSAAGGLELVVSEQTVEPGGPPAIEIDAGPSTPVGLVLDLVDAAAVAGATDLTFVGTPLPADGPVLSELVARLRAAGPARYATVNGKPLSAAPGNASTPDRVAGAYAGFAAHPGTGLEEEVEEELVEPDER